MRRAFVLGVVLAAACATQALAQWNIPVIPTVIPGMAPKHFDPYYVMPAEKGGLGVDAGLASGDVSSIGDASDIFVTGKYGIMPDLEVGVRATIGSLYEGKDALSTILVGAKYKTLPTGATTVDVLLPIGDAGDPGLAIGQMYSTKVGGIGVNNHLQVSFLDGYVANGVDIDLLVQQTKPFNDKLAGYLDWTVFTNTDDIGNWTNIDLLPNVDYMVSEGMLVNAGVKINLYNGIARNSDIGVRIGVIKTMKIGG